MRHGICHHRQIIIVDTSESRACSKPPPLANPLYFHLTLIARLPIERSTGHLRHKRPFLLTVLHEERHVGSSSFQVHFPLHVHDEPPGHPGRVRQALWQGSRECKLR